MSQLHPETGEICQHETGTTELPQNTKKRFGGPRSNSARQRADLWPLPPFVLCTSLVLCARNLYIDDVHNGASGNRTSSCCAATATDSVVKGKHFFITEGTTRLHRQDQASQCSLPHHRIPLRCRTVSSSWLGNINPAPCREAKQRWRHARAPLGFTGELHKQLLQIIVDRRGKEKRQTNKHHQAVTANHANPAYTIRLVQPIPHPPG